MNLKSFLTNMHWNNVTENSAITVPIDAPIAPYFEIKSILKLKFTIAPIKTDIVYCFCFFVGIRYCWPITLDIPINRIIGESNSKELNLPLFYETEIRNEYNENGELVFDNSIEKCHFFISWSKKFRNKYIWTCTYTCNHWETN